MTDIKPKTITTYLINGRPNGIKTIFVSDKDCEALVVPRAELGSLKDKEKWSHPALYFLINEDVDELYIGESENGYKRLCEHNSGKYSKDFWDIAILFFSSSKRITKTDAKHLEHLSIDLLKKAGNANLIKNNQNSSKPHMREHQMPAIEGFFDGVKLITRFLGYNFFNITNVPKNTNDAAEFYCTVGETNARAIMHDGEFIVLKGSKISANANVSQKVIDMRLKFVDSENLLTKDLPFKTPSAAGVFCMGTSCNGWIKWKDKSGNTLNDVIGREVKQA